MTRPDEQTETTETAKRDSIFTRDLPFASTVARTVMDAAAVPATHVRLLAKGGARAAIRSIQAINDRAQRAMSRPPWQQTQFEFLAWPEIRNEDECPAGAFKVQKPRDFKPTLSESVVLPMVGECSVSYDDRTHAVALFKEGRPIAVYAMNEILAVEPEFRDHGVGKFLVALTRTRYPHIQETRRTARAQRLQIAAHQLIIEQALSRGDIVPAEVLLDYPDLHGEAMYRVTAPGYRSRR